MDYEIIATLGPGSADPAVWKALRAAGASAFRLNTSHLSLEDLRGWLDRLDGFLASLAVRPPVVLDLQGSKWRLGQFNSFELVEGQSVELVHAAASQEAGILPVPHADFFKAAALSTGQVVLNDAKILLKLENGGAGRLSASVIRGGVIGSNKGITFTACDYRSEALNEKDLAILEQTRGHPGIRYAISYIKDAAEMAAYRAQINALAGQPAYLIAKLERRAAVEQAGQMAPSANQLWLCRGDLGAELGLVEMAVAVQRFSNQARSFAIPAILAGQVLEHMTTQPTPTRSEVCYLHDALTKGYRGVVLSDETAIGRYPVESCRIAALFRKTGPG
jgi:pyruvate kinase